jgi:hypothetical protein
MALPTAYLTSVKKLEGMLNAIQSAQAPPKFSQAFLEGLGFKSSADRLIINVLKALGFLTADGAPTDRYFRFLDQTQGRRVLAEGLQDAYADLYQLNREAHKMGRTELKGKLKTLTQGQVSDSVVDKMAMTFESLGKLADFSGPAAPPMHGAPGDEVETTLDDDAGARLPAIGLGGLVYNIELHLPESRDPAVYDALFRSLKSHLLS